LAQAEFIYKNEYAVEPSSDKCRQVFIKHGLQVLSLSDFKNKEI